MKNIISSPAWAVVSVCFCLLLILGACKKSTPSVTMGTFWFHLHTNIDTSEVDDTTALYRDSLGRHFGLSLAQFYISRINVHNVNGTTYSISNAVILKNIDSEQYIVGQAPAGTYDDVSFTIGLPPSDNGLAPAAFTSNGYVPNSTMWFGNTTDGYIYLKLQGFADTSAAQNGAGIVHFSYDIGKMFAVGGGDQSLVTVTMPVRSGAYQPYILGAGSVSYIHLICDYGKLLAGVDFKTQDSTDTHADVSRATAYAVIAGIPNWLRYEE